MRRALPLLVVCIIASQVAAAEKIEQLSTDDTAVGIAFDDSRLWLASLKALPDGGDFIARDQHPFSNLPFDVKWKFRSAKHSDNRFIVTFQSEEPNLRCESIWRARKGPGPIEHSMIVTNTSGSAADVPIQGTLNFHGQIRNHHWDHWTVEKGGPAPTDVGVHRERMAPGFRADFVSHGTGVDEPRERIPWVCVQDVDANDGWYAGVEFTGNARFDVGMSNDRMITAFGLTRENDELHRLAPGESYELPTVFIGCYRGEVDNGANRLRRWVRANLAPKVKDERYPLLVNNTWGSGMNIDEKLCRKMIDESAELGLEMFHIDAGWYRTVGDWRAHETKFPNGLAPIADYAHSKNLKFGLWVAWSHGGDAQVRDPAKKDWFTQDYPADWHASDFAGAAMCLAKPQAADECLATLRTLVREAKLDLLEHDQVMVLDDCKRTDHPHSASPTDTAYYAARGYYRVYDALKKEFPDLLLEDCVNGGRMIDYGVIQRCNYISITDTYTPLANRRAFYDASHALPPEMCECYVQNMPVKTLANFKHMLRSGMMGWCTIMLDTSQWTADQHLAAKEQFETYKTRLRPLIRNADLYHISQRPDGNRFDAMQYFDPQTQKGVVFAFRGTTEQSSETFRLRGLDPDRKYKLSFTDDTSALISLPGSELMKSGLKVQLSETESSELIFIE